MLTIKKICQLSWYIQHHLFHESVFTLQISMSHKIISHRVWEKKFEYSNTSHIHMKLTFSWPNYFNFHFDEEWNLEKMLYQTFLYLQYI